jgi:hypothetical protein
LTRLYLSRAVRWRSNPEHRATRWTTAVVLALSALAVIAVPATARIAPRGGATMFTTTSIGFSLNLTPVPGIAFTLQFATSAELTGGSIRAGQSLNGTATMTVPTTAMLGLTYLGTSTTIPVAPVGSLLEVPVPGLGLSYLGIPLGVTLNVSAEITGTSSVSGPATGGAGPLTWSTTGSHPIPIAASSSAAPGSVIVSSLSNIQYSLAMGLDAAATIPIFGHYVVHLLQFGHLGLFSGSPASVQASYQVPTPPSSSALSSFAQPGTAWLVGIGVVAAIAVVAVILWRRRGRPVPMTSSD